MKNEKVKIRLFIKDCSECPKVQKQRMYADGYNYYCTVSNKIVAEYIEYPSEMPSVPKDCPLR